MKTSILGFRFVFVYINIERERMKEMNIEFNKVLKFN